MKTQKPSNNLVQNIFWCCQVGNIICFFTKHWTQKWSSAESFHFQSCFLFHNNSWKKHWSQALALLLPNHYDLGDLKKIRKNILLMCHIHRLRLTKLPNNFWVWDLLILITQLMFSNLSLCQNDRVAPFVRLLKHRLFKHRLQKHQLLALKHPKQVLRSTILSSTIVSVFFDNSRIGRF
jgi:hypothetical protein